MFMYMLPFNKRLKIFLLFTVVFPLHALAQVAGPSDSLSRVLIAKEKEMFDILINGNKAAAQTLIAQDYITINADGVMAGKQETMKDLGKFKGSTVKLSERKIRTYGDIAIITGRAKFFMKSVLVAEIFYTQIWVFRDGRWQFLNWQGTMTGLPVWYPVFITIIVMLLLLFIVRLIKRKVKARLRKNISR